MKKLLLLIFLLSLSINSFSQDVTVTIEDIEVEDVPLPNGSPIDLGTQESINVKFTVNLIKESTYSIGDATVFIDVFDSFGNRTEYEIAEVPSSSFTDDSSASFEINIQDSDINYGDGNYLIAVLKQDNPPGVEWDSQEVPIVKTPAFELNPPNVNLDCGDTSPQTFTVTNSSSLTGVTYQWNTGNGWTGNVDDSNSITLTPLNGNSLPSDLSVTPIYNGENQPTLTTEVNRSAFSVTSSINGNNVICSNETYTVDNLPSNVSIISATSSDTNIATVNLDTNDQITVTKVSNGNITLTVELENDCSQTTPITKDIQVGENNNIDVTGLENGIDAGSSVDLDLTNTNGCGTITFTDASSGLSFDYVGPDYAVLSSTSSNSGTGWVYISISGGTSIYKEFPINTTAPPVLPDENLISIARISNDYTVYPYSQWKMVKVYYYGNSSDVDYWEWNVSSSYYSKPDDSSIIFLPSSSTNVTVNVRACNSDGCSDYKSRVIN